MTFALELEHRLGVDARRAGATVRRYRAASGLTLIIAVDHAAPVLVYQTWFRVGSRNERAGATGMAHLFEHLMFNSTESLAQGELDRMIERVGGETNAATWVDWTYYTNTLPASALELIAGIEADRMQHLVLTDEVLAAERDVVAAERMERVDDDVDGFLSEQLFKLAFTTHPYHWPTIGWMQDIRGAARADIEAFYRTYYAPNNATLVLVGDVDEERALALLEARYGGIAAADLPPDRVTAEPPQTEERHASFEKPVPADRAIFGYRTPPQRDRDWAALEIADTLLSGSASSRLYRRLVIEDELASSVDGGLMPFRDPGLYEISVSMTRGHPAEEARAAIDEEIAALIAQPVGAAELEKARNCVETDFWSSMASLEGKAEALGHFETIAGDFRALFD
ncbi:MAG TPA: pitrilysin family protein, partial [Kofleriaceae bacterium]|nr:pitrilysin family protein [Kofleriaceae bacterium]